eukprot:gene12316-8808_t
MNVQSALRKGGFEGETSISPQQSNKVLGVIDSVLWPYWWQHGSIHEHVFDEIFGGEKNIDTLDNQRAGKKPLSDLATNRQRFVMDNHECWQAEMRRRREAVEAVAAEKASKTLERGRGLRQAAEVSQTP